MITKESNYFKKIREDEITNELGDILLKLADSNGVKRFKGLAAWQSKKLQSYNIKPDWLECAINEIMSSGGKYPENFNVLYELCKKYKPEVKTYENKEYSPCPNRVCNGFKYIYFKNIKTKEELVRSCTCHYDKFIPQITLNIDEIKKAGIYEITGGLYSQDNGFNNPTQVDNVVYDYCQKNNKIVNADEFTKAINKYEVKNE